MCLVVDNVSPFSCEDMKQTETACSTYLQSSLQIFKNASVTTGEQENQIPTNLGDFITDPQCLSLAQSIICHQIYPYCSTLGSPQPRPVCAKACQVFTTGSCSKFLDSERYLTITDRLINGCDMSAREGGDIPECIPLSLEASKAGNE